MEKLEILYEDNAVIIVNKPAGLPVQGGKEIKNSLDKILVKMRPAGENSKPHLVHRLDKDTSGVLLAAKGRESAARFSDLINKNARKQYIAVCAGCPEKKEGSIAEELLIQGKIKKSKTKYKLIKNGEFPVSSGADTGSESRNLNFSVLELELITGRMHQIRRHLAGIGNPVLGDDKYGNFPLNRNLRKAGVKHLLLHASRLIINGDVTLDIRAPIPQYFSPFT